MPRKILFLNLDMALLFETIKTSFNDEQLGKACNGTYGKTQTNYSQNETYNHNSNKNILFQIIILIQGFKSFTQNGVIYETYKFYSKTNHRKKQDHVKFNARLLWIKVKLEILNSSRFFMHLA